MLKHGPQTGWLSFAPEVQETVIGFPAVPDPCAVKLDVIVPHSPTVTPGAIGLPEPQFEAVLKNVAGRAFAQLLPSPVPAEACATKTVTPPVEQAAVWALLVATVETFPAASTAATPSV